MSGRWEGVLGPAHPSSSLTPASLPGLSPSTAFSTRTRTGVLCRSRATSLLGDPRPKSLALPQVQVCEQCWNSAAPSWVQLATPGGDSRALIQGDNGRPAGAPADRQASPQPRAGPGELALWERRTVLGAWDGAGICLPGLHPVPLTCWREDSQPGSGVRCCPLEVTVGHLTCCSLGMPPFPHQVWSPARASASMGNCPQGRRPSGQLCSWVQLNPGQVVSIQRPPSRGLLAERSFLRDLEDTFPPL